METAGFMLAFLFLQHGKHKLPIFPSVGCSDPYLSPLTLLRVSFIASFIFCSLRVHWTLKKQIYFYFLHAFLWVWEDLKNSPQASVMCSQSSPRYLAEVLWALWVRQQHSHELAALLSQGDLHPLLTEPGNHGIPGLERNLGDGVQQPPCPSSACVSFLILDPWERTFLQWDWSTHWTPRALAMK